MKGLTRKSVLAFFMSLVLLIGSFGNVALTAKAAEDGTGLVKERILKKNETVLTDSTLVYKDDDLDVRYNLIDLMPGGNIVQGETYEVAVPSNLLIASVMNWDATIGESDVLCHCHYNNSTSKIEITFDDDIFGDSYAGGIHDAYIGFVANVDGSGKNAGDSITISGPTGSADDTTLIYGGDTVPTDASVVKTGAFVDEPSKLIEWTVTVKEGPNGESSLFVKDTFSANQQMVTDSFTVDGAAAEPSVSGQTLTYTLAIDNPVPNKEHVLKYRTVAYAIEQEGSECNVQEGSPLKTEAVNSASVHANENGPALDSANYNVTCDFGKVQWLEKKCLDIKTVPGNLADRYVTWQVKVHTGNYTFTNVVLHDVIKSAVISGSELSYIWESFKMVDDATGTEVPGAALSGSPLFNAEGTCEWETTKIPSLVPGDYTITYDVKITNYTNYKKNNKENTKMGNSAWATYDKVTASGTPGFGPGKTPVITVDAGDIATNQASLSKYLPTVHYSYDVSERGAEVHGLPWMISVNADKEKLTSDYCLIEVIGGWSTDEKKLPQHVASTTDASKVIFDVEVDDVPATAEQYSQIQIAPYPYDAREIQITFGNLLTEGHKVTFRFQTYIDETEKDYYEGHHMTDDTVRIAYNDVLLRNATEELIWKDASIWAFTQVLSKKFVSYNYKEHIALWRMEFNRDMMELKNAVITDTLQTGTLDHVEVVKHAQDSYMESYGTRSTLTQNPDDGVYYTFNEETKEVAVYFGDVPRKQTYTVYVYEKIDPADKVMDGSKEKSLATYNGEINITNTATLTKDGSSPVLAQADGVIDNKLFDKTAQIVSKGKATYTIYMNQARMTWPEGAKISDIMSAGLMPDLSSYKLYTADVAEDGTMTKVKEVAADKFSVTVKVLEAGNSDGAAEGSVKSTIAIPSTATNEAYIITYDVFVDQEYAGLQGISFDNTVTVDGKKNDGILATETIALSQLMGYGSGSLSYSTVKVVKQNEKGEVLKGAEFDLVYNNQVVNSGVTDENGEIEFSNLTPGFIYTLVETKAPTNYLTADDVTFVAPARGDSSKIDNPIVVVDKVDPDSVTISIPVSKAWVGAPADSAVIELKAGDDFAGELTLTAENQWSGSFDNLKKYDSDGNEITYTISEVSIPGYSSDISGDMESGFTVTNTITGKVDVSVEKVWVGPAAESVEIKLYADGNYADSIVLNEANNWKHTFENLEKYSEGEEIVYTIGEVSVAGYTSVITGDAENGFTVTNTIEGKVSVGVTKVWEGPAAASVEIKLLADDTEVDSQVLSAANNWQYVFEGLDKYKAGNTIKYTIAEVEIPGYTSVITGSVAAGYTVTNTNTETVSVPVTKVWVGTPADSAVVELYADDEYVKELTLTAADEWKGSFTGLQKYDLTDGHEIVYTVKEKEIAGYTSVVTGSAAAGYTVTNTITGKVTVDVKKVWVGPAAEKVEIKLLADGTVKDTKELNAGNNWYYAFVGLDKYNAGEEIEYTIEEVSVNGYSTVITGDAAEGFTITNTNDQKISIPVTKAWVGTPADSAVIHLLADNAAAKEMTLTAANDWKGSFADLRKYDAEDGHEIVYTIEEAAIAGYTSVITGDAADGFTVTNTNNEKISIPVTKVWVGTPAESVTVKLLADEAAAGELTLTAANEWKGSFTGLRKYDAEDGHEIVYTIEEMTVAGYSTKITGDAAEGFTVINTIEGKVTVDVKKVWVGPAAEKAEIKLLADGVVKDTKELNAGNNWYYAFVGLDKYNAGKEIEYTIEEVSIANYTSAITGNAADGYVVTNTNTEKVSIPVTKVWVGTPAESVTVKLLADGAAAGEMTLTAETAWKGTFAGFNKYAADGHEIEYKLSEVSVEGYTTAITGNAADGFVVTNTIMGKTSVSVEKKWVGAPADSVVIKLLADGTEVASKELSTVNNWKWTFYNLEKYNAGAEIQYTIEEVSIENYSSVITGNAADGFVVTNTNNEKINIPVAKAWVGTPASKAVVQLLADGTVFDTKTLTAANEWKGEFTNLRKYDAADGHEIAYTLTESEINGYSTVITGDAANGFNVTNTIEGKVSVGVTKKWVGPAAEKAVIKLLADGAEAATAELSEENNWQYTFAGLEQYNAGVEIQYTIEEVSMTGYTSVITGSMAEGFTVTNTNDETIIIPVRKVWVGGAEMGVTIQLKADGVVAGEMVLNVENEWKGIFAGFRKYDAEDGHEIEYRISEKTVAGYSTAITGNAETGYTVTNTRRTTTTTTTTPEEPKVVKKRSPKTGDDSHLILAVSLMAECLAGAFITMYLGKKKERK